MQRTENVVVFLLAASLLSAKAKAPVYFVTPCLCENNHGEDRWIAKTEWAAVPTQPSKFIEVTPSDMFAWAPLPGLNKNFPRQPQEQHWHKVTGRVVDVRVQEDGDIHFELHNVTGTKRGRILAEVPLGHPWCQLRRVVFSWTTKGTRFNRFQAPRQLTLRIHPVVTVLGKAFFDNHHAAKNPRLRNVSVTNKSGILAAWEIHPVSGITADRSVIPPKARESHR